MYDEDDNPWRYPQPRRKPNISRQRPLTEFTCPRCNGDWKAHVGVRGWNRCPHCPRVFSRDDLLSS